MNARGYVFGLVGLACSTSLFGCDDSEREPPPQYPAPLSGSGGSAATGACNGGSAGAPTGCTTDADPSPTPTAVTGPITRPFPSDGCGKVYPCSGRELRSLATEGTKAANCAAEFNRLGTCGPWTAQRSFAVFLPQAYDNARSIPYPLVIEAPACGARAYDVDPFSDVRDTVVRVGIEPGITNHAGCPEIGCFDDHEGDDSIDLVFFERLYDKLNAELCFDRNRVFVSGHATGATLANELGGKYAGDSLRPVRGTLVYDGELPAVQAYVPTFSEAPLAGLWFHEQDGAYTPFENAERAIGRAMLLAHCPGGDYQHAQLENWPVAGGAPDGTCQRIIGCDSLYPLAVCAPPHSAQGTYFIMEQAFSTFIKLFSSGSYRAVPQ